MRKTCLPPPAGGHKPPPALQALSADTLFGPMPDEQPHWRSVLATHALALRELRDRITDAFEYGRQSKPLVTKLEIGRWWYEVSKHHEAHRQYERILAEHEAHLRFCGVSDHGEESEEDP